MAGKLLYKENFSTKLQINKNMYLFLGTISGLTSHDCTWGRRLSSSCLSKGRSTSEKMGFFIWNLKIMDLPNIRYLEYCQLAHGISNLRTYLWGILGRWDILLLNFPSIGFIFELSFFTNADVVTIKDETSKENS